jgi:hypothetical protein
MESELQDMTPQKEIPIYIIVFNNLTYLKNMIRQLERFTDNIIVINNCSTYQPLLDYLKYECPYIIINNEKNLLTDTDLIDHLNPLFPDYFVITDPDLELPSSFNAETLIILKKLTVEYQVYKAGLSLCIDSDQDFRDIKCRDHSIREWEGRYWTNRLDNSDDLVVYRADVATTFALYNKKQFHGDYYQAVRLAGPYQCKHLPWYKTCRVPDQELDYYLEHQKYSWWSQTKKDVGMQSRGAIDSSLKSHDINPVVIRTNRKPRLPK